MRATTRWRRWVTALAGLILTFAAIGSAVAQAAPAQPTGPAHGLAVLRTVLASPDQGAALSRLSGADRAAFDAVTVPRNVVLLESRGTPAAIDAVSPNASNVALAAISGCWSAWQRWGAHAAAGNTLYTWWLGLRWCGSNGTITSYSVFDRGGESSTPGWTFSGNGGAGSWNVGWEARQYIQERFTFGVGWFSYTNTDCGQIRGGATGLYSYRASCGLN